MLRNACVKGLLKKHFKERFELHDEWSQTFTRRGEAGVMWHVSLIVLEDYIRGCGFESVRLSSKRTGLDLAIRSAGVVIAEIRFSARTIQGFERWSSTTHTYLDLGTLRELQGKQPVRKSTVLWVYVAKSRRPGGRGNVHNRGCNYNVFAVAPEQLLCHARSQAAGSQWDGKCDVSSEVMERIARPLSDWLVAAAGVDVSRVVEADCTADGREAAPRLMMR